MPKMKSNSGARKRFKTTASGRVKRKKAYSSHILTKKSPKTKRNLRKATLVDAADEKRKAELLEEEKAARLAYERAVVPERLVERAAAMGVATPEELAALTGAPR